MTATTRLFEIVGEALSEVAFVHDYIELRFDDKILRALVLPSIANDRGRFVVPEPGSRDALCELIGKTVIDVVAEDGDRIEVRFNGGSAVLIPLGEDELIGPEAANYVPGIGQPIEVW